MSIVEELVEKIGNLTLIDAVNLRKTLETKFDVKAQNQVAIAPTVSVEKVEEKSSFSLHIVGFEPSKKINVIKTLKSTFDIPLTDAKSITDSLPKVIKEDLSKDDAEKLAKELRDAGATVEVK